MNHSDHGHHIEVEQIEPFLRGALKPPYFWECSSIVSRYIKFTNIKEIDMINSNPKRSVDAISLLMIHNLKGSLMNKEVMTLWTLTV